MSREGPGPVSWDHLPNVIKKYIIGFNPSLSEIHTESFSSSLSDIRSRRRDRQCTLCVRESIFSSPMCGSLSRRPSTRMYITLTGPTSSGARIRCMCKEHLMSDTEGEVVIPIPRDAEYPSQKFSMFLHTVFNDVSSIIVYVGVDEDDLGVIDALRNGDMVTTRDSPRPRWKRVVL